MTSEQTRYREFTPWERWVRVVVWGVVLLACSPALLGGDGDIVTGRTLLVLGLLFALVGAILRVVGGLTVLIQETRIVVHLGRAPVLSRSISFAEIVSLDSVEYRPIRDFGGWGIRGFGKRKAWTARGHRAVALRLTGDRELLIGSDHPKRLEERIRALAGIRRHD